MITTNSTLVPRYHLKKIDFKASYFALMNRYATTRSRNRERARSNIPGKWKHEQIDKHHAIPRCLAKAYNKKTYTVVVSKSEHELAHLHLAVALLQHKNYKYFNQLRNIGSSILSLSEAKPFLSRIRVYKKDSGVSRTYMTLREASMEICNTKIISQRCIRRIIFSAVNDTLYCGCRWGIIVI